MLETVIVLETGERVYDNGQIAFLRMALDISNYQLHMST